MSIETINAFQNEFKEKFKKLQDDFNRNDPPFGEQQIIEIKKQLDRMISEQTNQANSQPNIQQQLNHQIKMFVEAAHQCMIHILSIAEPQVLVSNNETQKLRHAVLDFLQKKVIQTAYSNRLVECMVDVMERDNEKNALLVPKILNETIKACNQKRDDPQRSQSNIQTSQSVQGIETQTLLKVYSFLVNRTSFISNLGQELIQSQFALVPGECRPNIYSQQLKQTQGSSPLPNSPILQSAGNISRSQPELKPNNKSIQFIGLIPHIFVHLMAYSEMGCQDIFKNQVNQNLQKSIQNILHAMKETPYQDILQRMPRWFSQELFNAFQKLAQFLFIILKRDKELENSQNLVQHVKEQTKYIQLDQVIAIVIKFLKNCPEELLGVRLDMMYRMRTFLQSKREQQGGQQTNDKIQDIMANTLELIDDELVLGKCQRLAPMNKSNLQNYWLEIIRVLIMNYLQRSENAKGQTTDKMLIDFLNNQTYMEKIFDTLIKFLFDEQTHTSVHEKSLELMKLLLDQFNKIEKYYFIDQPTINAFIESINQTQQTNTQQQYITLDGLFGENHNSLRYRLLNRLLDVIGRKLEQVHKMFLQARRFLQKYDRWGQSKRIPTSFTNNLNTDVSLSSMPTYVQDSTEEQKTKLLQYVKSTKMSIQPNLLSLNDQQQSYLVCFEDDEELILNSCNINTFQHYEDFVKESKTKVIDNLIDLAMKVIHSISSTNQGLLAKYREVVPIDRQNPSANQTPLFKETNGNKGGLYLSHQQIISMTRTLKNSLLLLEELHHSKLHYEWLMDKKRHNPNQFMQLFVILLDPTNFRDVFEPNTEHLLRLLIKLQQECCAENGHCLEMLLDQFTPADARTQPPYTQRTQANQLCNPNFLEFLMGALLKELQNSPEQPSKLGYCRTNKRPNKDITQQEQEDYVQTLLKLVRTTIREFTKTREDRVFRPIIKQLTLFLIKKLHESYYPLDYIAILISLIKRIGTNEHVESLQRVFQLFCEKPCDRSKLQSSLSMFHNLNYTGVNIALNLFHLFQTNVLELQDNVAEFIVHLPISRTQTVGLARSYPIYAECIYRALHYMNYETASVLTRSLSVLEIITSMLSQEELRVFFGDGLDRMLHKLVLIAKEIKNYDQNNKSASQPFNDPFFKAMKVLGRLGTLARNNAWQVDVMMEEDRSLLNQAQIKVALESLNGTTDLSIDFTECVRCATDILNQTLQKQIVAAYFFKPQSQEYSYKLIRLVVSDYLLGQENLILIDESTILRCTNVLIGLLNISVMTPTTQSSLALTKIKEENKSFIQEIITKTTHTLVNQLIEYGKQLTLGSYTLETLSTMVSKYARELQISQDKYIIFLRMLLESLMKRVVVVYDEAQHQKEAHTQIFEFIWVKQIQMMINQIPLLLKQSNQTNQQLREIFSFSIFIEFLKLVLIANITKECLIDRSDAINSHLRMLQAFGQSTNPSEGINTRTACIEALTQLHTLQMRTLRPRASLDSLEAAIITMSQLPDHIKLRTTLMARDLAFSVLEQYVGSLQGMEEEEGQVLSEREAVQSDLRRLLGVLASYFCPRRQDVCTLLLDLLEYVQEKIFQGDAFRMYYMDLSTGECSDSSTKIPKTVIFMQAPQVSYVNIGMNEIIQQFQNTLLGKILSSVKKILFDKYNVQRYSNAFIVLEFLLGLKGKTNQSQFYLFAVLIQSKGDFSDLVGQDYKFPDDFQQYLDLAFSLYDRNEKQYMDKAKLIYMSYEGNAPSQWLINPHHYLDDLEYGINIEHVDLEVKEYSQMIKNIYLFCKSVLTLPHVQFLSKMYQKKIDKTVQERQMLLNVRFRIVEMLYEGLTRVENSIRKTAYKAIRELLQQENGLAKELFQNDDKLKRVMKAVLTCLQLEPFQFVPSFLYSLKMILKLFTQVFHRTLSERMQLHLGKIGKETQGSGLPTQQHLSSLTTQEWFQPQFPESLQFQTSCIYGILNLFQHLTSSFHLAQQNLQQGGAQGTGASQNPAQDVIKETIKIENNYKRRVGRERIKQILHKPLVKFLNTVSALAFEDFTNIIRLGNEQTFRSFDKNPLNVTGIQSFLLDRFKHLKMLTSLIKEKSAYPLRERFCRETTNFTTKLLQIDGILMKVQDYTRQAILQLYQQAPNQGPEFPVPQPQTQHNQQNPQQNINYQQLQQTCLITSNFIIELVNFTYYLTKSNCTWLKDNVTFFEFLRQRILNIIEQLNTHTLLNQSKTAITKTHFLLPFYNQLMIPVWKQQELLEQYTKIMVNFTIQNPENSEAILSLLNLMRFTRKASVEKWVLQVATNGSVKQRQQLLALWLSKLHLNVTNLNPQKPKPEIPYELQLHMGYYVIYPVILHSRLRGDLDLVVDLPMICMICDRVTDLLEDFNYLRKLLSQHWPILKVLPSRDQTLSHYNSFFTGVAVDLLQLVSFIVNFSGLFETGHVKISEIKKRILKFGWELTGSEEKLVDFFAKLYLGRFFLKFRLGAVGDATLYDRMLKIYHKVLRFQEENINQQDQDINVLCRKIIQVIVPYLDEKASALSDQQYGWVNCTLQIFRQEHLSNDSENMQKLCRFWSMFIRNHETFQQHYQIFTNHIINSMQQIGCNNQPIVSPYNSLYSSSTFKRIALDIAFLSVEWRFIALQRSMKGDNVQEVLRQVFQQDLTNQSPDERLSQEIYVGFFIKQALLAQQIEERDLQKRSLYLLKKVLLTQPSTVLKFNMTSFKRQVENITTQLINDAQQLQAHHQPHPTMQQMSHPQNGVNLCFKFFTTVMTIINIILEFQPQKVAATLLNNYLEILGPSQQSQNMVSLNIQQNAQILQQTQTGYRQPQPQQPQQRYPNPQPTSSAQKPMGYPGTGAQSQNQQQIPAVITDRTSIQYQMMMIDHPQLVFYISSAIRKLINVAFANLPSTQPFINSLLQMARETLDKQQLPLLHNQNQRRTQTQYIRAVQQPPVQSQTSPMAPKQAVFVVKEIFNRDSSLIVNVLVGLKNIAIYETEYMKRREKVEYYLKSLKQHPRKSKMEVEGVNCVFQSYLEDFKMEQEDFPYGIENSNNQIYFSDDFPTDKLKFHLQRTTVLKCFKVLAYKFNEIPGPNSEKDQEEYLDTLLLVIEMVQDWELKMEVITILRLLFLNFQTDEEMKIFTQEIGQEISEKRVQELWHMYRLMKKTGVQPVNWSLDMSLSFFFDLGRMKRILEKKLDVRSSESWDNNGDKILDNQILKLYFVFLCELMMSRGRATQSMHNLISRVKDVRSMLLVVSKLPSCAQYFRFMSRCIFNVIGNSEQSLMSLLFINPIVKKQQQEHQSTFEPPEPESNLPKDNLEVEELLLLFVKILIIGKGILKNPSQKKYFSLYMKLLTSEYQPLMLIYNQTKIPLQNQVQYLKDVIVPASALNILDKAQNISSRLLRPLFINLLNLIQPTETHVPFPPKSHWYNCLIEYLRVQPISNGVQDAIAKYLLGYITHKPLINPNLLSTLQIAQFRTTIDQLVITLNARNMWTHSQYLLEELNWHLRGAKSEALLQVVCDNEGGLMQSFTGTQERRNRLAVWQTQATLPWVKQLVFLCQLHEPRRQLQLIISECDNNLSGKTHAYWNQVDEDGKIEANQDATIVHTMLIESLTQLGQWGQVKKLLSADTVSTAENSHVILEMGLRQRSRETIKETLDILMKQRSTPRYLEQYYSALMKLIEHDELIVQNTGSTNAQPTQLLHTLMVDVNNSITIAQLICLYQVNRLARSNSISHQQWMSNQLFIGESFREQLVKVQLLDELEEVVKPFISMQNMQTVDMLYENNLNLSHSYRRKKPSLADGLELASNLQHQRILMQSTLYLRFQLICPQVSRQHMEVFKSAFIDPDLTYYAHLRKLDLLDFVDDQVLREVPTHFQEHVKKSLLFERAKHAVQFRNDHQKALNLIEELLKLQSQHQTLGNLQAEDCKNRQLAKIYRLKLICSMNLTKRSDCSIEETQKELVDKALEYPQNQFKVFRALQRFYFEAHRNFNSNIQFAYNVIKLAPHMQNLKQTLPELSGMFYILLITNPNDSYVLDAFRNIGDQLNDSVVLFFLPQLILLTRNEQLRDTVVLLLLRTAKQWPQFFYHQDSSLRDIVKPNDIDFYTQLATLSVPLEGENILELCGSIMEQFAQVNPSKREVIVTRCIELGQLVSQMEKSLQAYCTLNIKKDVAKCLTQCLKEKDNQKIFNLVQITYLTTLKYLYREKLNQNIGDPKANHMTRKLAQEILLHKQVKIPSQQLFELHKKMDLASLPDIMNSYIYAIFPYMEVKLVNDQYLQRSIILISQDEKRHKYIINRRNDNPKNSLLNQQFLDFVNIMLKRNKESLVRFMEIKQETSYLFYSGCNQLTLTQHNQTCISLTDIQNQFLIERNFEQELGQVVPFFLLNHSREQMQAIIPEDLLQMVILRVAKTIEIYQALRKTFLSTLAVQLATSFVLSETPRPNIMHIDLQNGKYFNSTQQFESNTPNPLAVRLTRNFEKLCGDIGVNGYLVPGFAAFGLALSYPVLNFPTYLIMFNYQMNELISNVLNRKINLMVFDEECHNLYSYTSMQLKNKFELLLETSKKIYGGLNQNELKQWI